MYELDAVVYRAEEVREVFCGLGSVYRRALHLALISVALEVWRLREVEHVMEELRVPREDTLMDAERRCLCDE